MPEARSNHKIVPAAMRRAKRPVTFTFSDGEPEGSDEEFTLRVDPLLDIARFGQLFGEFAEASEALVKLDDSEVTTMLADIDRIVNQGRDAFRACLVPPDRTTYDEKVRPFLGVHDLIQIVQVLVSEMTGMDPTSPPESSDGSSAVGITSSDGASPTAELPPPPSQ